MVPGSVWTGGTLVREPQSLSSIEGKYATAAWIGFFFGE